MVKSWKATLLRWSVGAVFAAGILFQDGCMDTVVQRAIISTIID